MKNTTIHTERDIDEAAARFERLADELDPTTTPAENTEDLRRIAVAADAVAAAEAELREAVAIARAHDRSWNRIAVALGVSRQAARQRFATPVIVGESEVPKSGRGRRKVARRA